MTDPIAMLFDLDGTLIHSSGDIAAAINRMLSTLGFTPRGGRVLDRPWSGSVDTSKHHA